MARTTRKNTQVTIGSLAPKAAAVLAVVALSWGTFTVAFAADAAVAAASAKAESTAHVMSGALRAQQIECAETGVGC